VNAVVRAMMNNERKKKKKKFYLELSCDCESASTENRSSEKKIAL